MVQGVGVAFTVMDYLDTGKTSKQTNKQKHDYKNFQVQGSRNIIKDIFFSVLRGLQFIHNINNSFVFNHLYTMGRIDKSRICLEAKAI